MTRSKDLASLTICLVLFFGVLTACSAAAPGDPAAKKTGGTGGSSVAVIEGKVITKAELEEKAAPSLRQVRQEEYNVLQQTLDEMINDQLLEKEAKTQGIAKDALLQKEIAAKVGEPAQAEIDQLWEANKSRVGTKTKDQLLPDIINFLKNQKTQEIQKTYHQGLRTKYKVQVLLEPPRVNVAVDDDPAKGPADAPITIVEFSDFQCPYCSRAEGTLKQVLDKYKDKVRFVYRDLPLAMHTNAQKASEAAQCAHDQGKFWDYHDALYSDQSKLGLTDLEATATRLGLDADKFKSCLNSGKFADEVRKDMEDAQKAGVSSTPFFFINGIPVVGAQGYQAFVDVIDRELARAGK